MAIVGPWRPLPPVAMTFTLEDLRRIRWNALSTQDKGVALQQAGAVLREVNDIGYLVDWLKARGWTRTVESIEAAVDIMEKELQAELAKLKEDSDVVGT